MEERKRIFLNRIKSLNFELASSRIFLCVIFLLPLFVLPFGIFAVDFNKAMLTYIGISTSAVLFLLWSVSKKGITCSNSFIIKSLFLVALAWFTSALFSKNISLSMSGAGYETGTAVFIFYLAVIVFLISALFRKSGQLAQIYKAIFFSAIILFAVQLLHTGFGVAVPPWGMFQGKLASVLGSWSDIGIFFGLIVILSISSIEYGGEGRKGKIFLWVVLVISLIAIYFVNFSTLQYVLGFSVLALMVYRLANPPHFEGVLQSGGINFLSPSLFVFLVIAVFTFAHQWTGGLINFLGIQFSQVNPSWTATFDVIRGALSSDFILGSGPNTFLNDWLMFKPEAISNSVFWDARFISGAGRLPSMVAEVGLLGILALITFTASLLYAGRRVFSYKEHSLERMLLVSSFFGSLYLWIFTIIYSPGFLIFIFAGILTGIFVASLGLVGGARIVEFEIDKNTKKGFIANFIILLMILGFVLAIFMFGSKYIAGYYYTAGIKEATIYNNAEKADVYLRRAVVLDPQDVYFRSSAEIGLVQLGQMISQSKETASDSEKTQFGNVLTATVQSAKNATIVNPLEPENWMELGRVYETILQLDPEGFKSSAIFAYGEAIRVSPNDPTPLLSLARVELQSGNTSEALKYLNDSLKIKSDFTAGHIMLAEVAVGQGNLKEAISELEKTVISNPNNPDNIYIILRIGVLYYQDGYHEKARTIFENLVSINPNYIDARYSLGLVYYETGMIDEAIEQFEAIKKLAPENNEVQVILDRLRSGAGLPIE